MNHRSAPWKPAQTRPLGLVLGCYLLAGVVDPAGAQVLHRKGQSIQPVYEGFEANPDGTFTMWFGYLNRNYEEHVHMPLGPDNFFQVARGVTEAGPVDPARVLQDPGPVDGGQPTFFYPRRQLFVFGVTVPADFGDKELVWTVRRDGEAYTAVGSLRPANIWKIDEGIWKANRHPMFAGISGRTEIEFQNQPPTVEVVGTSHVTTSVESAATLTVRASDDGHPGPREWTAPVGLQQADDTTDAPPPPWLANPVPAIGGGTGGAPAQNMVSPVAAFETGLAVTWLHYRGSGQVTFEPAVSSLDPAGGEATTSARFSQPGTYVIRGYADDGHLTRSADVTVVVQ